jgi:recombination protein RecA
MIGGLADHPFFFAERPDIYEELMELNRSFLHKVDELRLGKLLAEDASALVVVDSLRKLVPRNIAKAVEDSVLKHGADGVGGRSGQVRAAMNAAWMDELVPLLDKTRTAFVAIARESEDPDADAFMRARGHAYKVGGGKAIYYDASMVFRVERESYVTKPTDKEKKEAPVVYGERHRVTIRKTKVAGHEDKYTVGYFHTSNGRLVPFGYDRARDLLELGERFGVVEKSGAWYSFGGERIAQGRDNVVVNLTANRPMMDAIELAVRARFADNPVEEHDADGVVA